MLHTLADLTFATPTTRVRTPHAYQFIPEANIQVHEDVSDATDLRTVLLSSSPTLDSAISPSFPSPLRLGRSLGSWLRRFHDWASEPTQATLRETIGQNEPMRKI